MDIVIKQFLIDHLSEKEWNEISQIDEDVFGIENKWSISNFKSDLDLKNELSFLAKVNNQVIAYIICSAYKLDCEKVAHINRIARNTSFKGTGIGSELIRTFELSAQKLGIVRLTLEFDCKLAVDNFYLDNGYSQVLDEKSIIKYLESKNKMLAKNLYLDFKRKVYTKKILQ